jgi:hypothetical protein
MTNDRLTNRQKTDAVNEAYTKRTKLQGCWIGVVHATLRRFSATTAALRPPPGWGGSP